MITALTDKTHPRKTQINEDRLEARTQAIGRKLFAGVRRHEPPTFSLQKLDAAIMRLMMVDEDLRFRLLRFVDVYPSLKDARALAQHLEEFLTHPSLASGSAPTPLSAVARAVGADRSATRALLKVASRFGIERMGSQFIAGDSPESVAKRIVRMEQEGFLFSLDLLGEFVASERQADAFQARYLEMIERFGRLLGPGQQEGLCGPRVNISIKLSSLTSKFEPMDPEGTSSEVRRRLRPLARAAMRRGVFLNVDMEKYEYRDLTLQILLDLLDEEEFRGWPNLGTVHQAYLRDADECLRWFLGELRRRRQPLTIRLVKGAYWDSEQIWARAKGWPVPVITHKPDTDAMYERCSRILAEENDLVRMALGSHNVRSIAHAIALGRELRIPQGRLESQMLYGMAGPIKDALRTLGLPVRIYTPCGELIPGMAYLVRRILENTSNESFLRQRFADGVAEERLLENPRGNHWTEGVAAKRSA
jgi:RHH-type proline utilization regulon transcriptional repressor/proline dehydrogenase/delta 1-pyrroline-5-carboxylate dehydrogenase